MPDGLSTYASRSASVLENIGPQELIGSSAIEPRRAIGPKTDGSLPSSQRAMPGHRATSRRQSYRAVQNSPSRPSSICKKKCVSFCEFQSKLLKVKIHQIILHRIISVVRCRDISCDQIPSSGISFVEFVTFDCPSVIDEISPARPMLIKNAI